MYGSDPYMYTLKSRVLFTCSCHRLRAGTCSAGTTRQTSFGIPHKLVARQAWAELKVSGLTSLMSYGIQLGQFLYWYLPSSSTGFAL